MITLVSEDCIGSFKSELSNLKSSERHFSRPQGVYARKVTQRPRVRRDGLAREAAEVCELTPAQVRARKHGVVPRVDRAALGENLGPLARNVRAREQALKHEQ